MSVEIYAEWSNLSFGPINHAEQIARIFVHQHVEGTKIIV